MIRWALAWLVFLVALLGMFVALGEVDALRHLEGQSLAGAAALSVALLASDIVLPIPSSVLMTFNGALFSLLPGATVSLIGLLAGSLLGYGLARVYGKKLLQIVAANRKDESVSTFFERYGFVAVVLSRPIPLIAEMITCMAGTADMPLGRFLVAQLVGGVPLAFGYAWAGEYAADHNTALLALFVAVAVPSLLWLVWALARNRRQRA